MSIIYQINKGINRPIEFRGLRGQYIGWLAGGLVFLLIAFAIGYVTGVPLYLLVPGVLLSGGGLFWTVNKLSKRFGVHGLDKFFARRSLPGYVRFRSRRLFTGLLKGRRV